MLVCLISYFFKYTHQSIYENNLAVPKCENFIKHPSNSIKKDYLHFLKVICYKYNKYVNYQMQWNGMEIY